MAARTCMKCRHGEPHEFKHGTLHSFQYHGCRCSDCKCGARTQCNKWRRANPEKCKGTHGTPEVRRDYYERTTNDSRRHYAVTVAKFNRAAGGAAYRRWRPEEDAIVMRPDLSLLEIAYLLGRNRGSILYRRSVLREEQVA